MKIFTLQKLGLLTFLLLFCSISLLAQEKRGIAVVKKITREDGTTTVEKEHVTGTDGLVKELKSLTGKDVKIHLVNADQAGVKINEENGETLIFVRSAAHENDTREDLERLEVIWHDENGETPKVEFKKTVTHERPILGVYTDDHADVQGIKLNSVTSGKGAQVAGLQKGDVITSVAGKAVSNTSDLRSVLANYKPGDKVTVQYLRNDQPAQVEVTLSGEKNYSYNPGTYSYSYSNHRDPCKVFIGVGTSIMNEGLRVDYTVDDTPAENYGVRAGDIILALDGKNVVTQSELVQERDKHQPGEAFTLTVLRDGKEMKIDARFKECNEEDQEKFRQEQEEKMERMHERMEETRVRMAEMRERVQSERRENLVKVERDVRPILGVYVNESADAEGIVLSNVSYDKGAAAAGLQGGDVVTTVEGQAISSTSALRKVLAGFKPGDKVNVVYLRDGQSQQAQVELSGSREYVSYMVERNPCDVFIGVYTADRGIDGQGVRVTGVIEDTPAKSSGVQPGDVILALDDAPTNGHMKLRQERDKHQPGDPFTLSIIRDGQYLEIDATFKACPTDKPVTPVEEIVEIASEDAPAEQESIPQLDLNSELKVESFNMYPNPTVGMLNVQFEAEAVPTTVRILDSSGKEVYSEQLNSFNGYYNNQLNLSGKTPGTYILTVQQGKKLTTKKIVLMPRV